MKKVSQPKKLGSSVSSWIRSARMGPGARIRKVWDDRVEPSLKVKARLAELKSDTLWVEVETSAALEEMATYGREPILRELASEGIREVRFVLPRKRPWR
ncbi:MAG: DciA family protein [Planctomycetota bacterium]|nr:DciA family protein [Planctomycetota bacterium]